MHIWDNVTIKKGCKVTNALICNDVVVHANVELKSGAILCNNVSIFIAKVFLNFIEWCRNSLNLLNNVDDGFSGN